MEPIILDNTKRSQFRACKKKYELSSLHGWQSGYGSTAIRYGVGIHGIMEGFYSWIKEHGWFTDSTSKMQAIAAGLELGKHKFDKESEKKQFLDDYRNFNTAVEAFGKYLDYFADDAKYLKVLATETKFECPIEPESNEEEKLMAGLPPIVFTGRIDLSVEMDYNNWIWDFKTTGWILDQVISRANRSPQLLGYSYAGSKVLNFTPSGCLCSFIYTAASKKKDGTYGDTRFDFRRVPQIYAPGDIAAWKLSFIDTCREIYQCTQTGIWPESFDNCYQYGPCSYLRLCQQHVPVEDLNLDGYHQEFWDVLEDGD